MTFGGEAHKYVEWKAKLLAHLRVNVGERIGIWAKRGQTQKEEVTDDSAELEYGYEEEQVNEFSPIRHSGLTMCLVSSPCRMLPSAPEGGGLEAFSLLVNRYEPRVALTERAHPKAIVTSPPAKRIGERGAGRKAPRQRPRTDRVRSGKQITEQVGHAQQRHAVQGRQWRYCRRRRKASGHVRAVRTPLRFGSGAVQKALGDWSSKFGPTRKN